MGVGGDREGGASGFALRGTDPRSRRPRVTGRRRRRRVRQGLAGGGRQGVAGDGGVLELCSQLPGRLEPSGPRAGRGRNFRFN